MPIHRLSLLISASLLLAACGGDDVSRDDLIASARAGGMRSSQATCLADELLDEFDQTELAVIVAAQDIEDAADDLGQKKVDKVVRIASACGAKRTTSTEPGTTEDTEADTTEVTEPEAETTLLTAPDLPADRAGATRQAPVPFKQIGAIGAGWSLRIDGYVPNADAAVKAANEFNEVPEPGMQYAIVTVNAAFGGPADKAALVGEVFFKAVGPKGLAYDATDCYAVLPNNLDLFNDVFSGGSLTGEVCFLIDPADAAGLVLYADTYDSSFELNSTFFALA